MLYPQVGVIAMNSENGGHSSMPVLGVPMPQEQAHYADGTPQKKNLLIVELRRHRQQLLRPGSRTRPGSST